MPPRPMTIEQALHWAFATERAQLDFDEAKGDNARPGVSPLYTIIQRGHLGCSVDGGGHSLPHHEADMIASAVANLPADLGGKGMAVTVATHARAFTRPDWRCPAPAIVPQEWRFETQEGREARAVQVGVEKVPNRRGRVIDWPLMACPVRHIGTAEDRAFARRRYSEWRRALVWLADHMPALCEVRLIRSFPSPCPWEQVSDMAKAG